MTIDSRSVIVTGAGSGIGRAIASRLADQGMQVIGADLDERLLAGLSGLPGNLISHQVDVADPASVDTFFETMDARNGVRGLVNAAGIGGEPGDVSTTDLEYWQRVIAVNLTGVFLMSRRAVPLIATSGGGSIVHIASQLGMVGAEGSPAYSASKGGVIALARSMALDHAAQQIRVNAVCPGPIDTPMFRSSSGPANMERLTSDLIPWGRIGKPEEVAALVAYLISDESQFMTGAVLAIDGGWTAR